MMNVNICDMFFSNCVVMGEGVVRKGGPEGLLPD